MKNNRKILLASLVLICLAGFMCVVLLRESPRSHHINEPSDEIINLVYSKSNEARRQYYERYVISKPNL